ncbi:MAG: hypothetical protein NZS48_13425, partial [Gemmata sp.]|nr:hypothetical protein [Gemmata sp.]
EGTLTLRAGTDELTVALIEPVDDLRRLTQGTIDLALQGDLSRWKARIAAVTTIPPYALNGSISARGKVRLAQDRLTIDRLAVELRQVHFHGAGLTIRESTIQATTDVTVSWSTVNRSIRFGSLELQSAALTVADGVLEFRLPQDGPLSVSGQGKCTADLNRVGRIVGLYPEADGPDALHGRGEGPIFFQHAGDVTSFRGSLQVMNFAYGWKNEPSWREPQFTLHVDGRYTDSTDRMAFTTIQVNRPGCLLETTGAIAHVTTTPELNFTGRWHYDWQQLSPAIREWLGRSFTATGTGTRSFTLRGALGSPTAGAVAPLRQTDRPIVLQAPPGSTPPASPSSFANLEGEAAIGWNSMTLHGFDMGPADITAKMTAGVVTINPLTATLGGGKITLSPTVKLDTTPGELRFASGRIVERAPLTPQAIAGALGYALPAIANAAHAEGEISAILDDNRIPLNDLTQAHLRGSLVIHQAVVGAGPVVAEIAQLLGMEKTSITIVNESTVPVQVAHGRIYHQDFTFRISGTTIKTRGSVGFDNTLDLIVEVPLPKDWPALRNNPILLKAVSGKIVPVPVRGTLARPQVDFRALEQAVRALARASVKDTGRELLERELNQLFPGLPARPNSGPPASPGSPLPFPIPRPFGPKP